MVLNATQPVMTDIEQITYNWLLRRGINFDFQTSLMGGIFQLGGTVVDFIITDRMLAWRVFGEYWHKGVEKSGSDIIQREQLVAMGYTVVDIWSDDILERTEETLKLALQGQEMLR